MSGLEMIINQIEEEATASAERILQEANGKADGVKREAEAEAERLLAQSEQNCAALKENILQKGRSSAHMQRQRDILFAKQELIDGVIADAKTSLNTLEDREYFSLISRMLKRHVQPRKGKIRFNKKDLNRLPKHYKDEISDIAAEVGGTLTLDKNPADIDGGFVLIYGGIEENCSFRSVFGGAEEQLRDKLHRLLFLQ